MAVYKKSATIGLVCLCRTGISIDIFVSLDPYQICIAHITEITETPLLEFLSDSNVKLCKKTLL